MPPPCLGKFVSTTNPIHRLPHNSCCWSWSLHHSASSVRVLSLCAVGKHRRAFSFISSVQFERLARALSILLPPWHTTDNFAQRLNYEPVQEIPILRSLSWNSKLSNTPGQSVAQSTRSVKLWKLNSLTLWIQWIYLIYYPDWTDRVPCYIVVATIYNWPDRRSRNRYSATNNVNPVKQPVGLHCTPPIATINPMTTTPPCVKLCDASAIMPLWKWPKECNWTSPLIRHLKPTSQRQSVEHLKVSPFTHSLTISVQWVLLIESHLQKNVRTCCYL